jgi:hypothetical protein
MMRKLVTSTLLLLAMLTAVPAMAQGRYRGNFHPQYQARTFPQYRHRTSYGYGRRSHFHYRNPYQWEAEKNYLRNRSRLPGLQGGYYESYFFGYGGGQQFWGR